jgi:hypothetical protein
LQNLIFFFHFFTSAKHLNHESYICLLFFVLCIVIYVIESIIIEHEKDVVKTCPRHLCMSWGNMYTKWSPRHLSPSLWCGS